MSLSCVIDTHVHLYPQYDILKFFNSAWKNLQALAPGSMGILCFTERKSENYFQSLEEGEIPGVDIHTTEDPGVLHVELEHGSLLIISGYQYTTKESLEVLSLCSTKRVSENAPLLDTISQILSQGSIPVVPWSPGKWLGGRRKVIHDFMKSELFDESFLGDIYGHPWWFREPLLNALNARFLSGSDPLPKSGEESVVGRSAVLCDFPEQPISWILKNSPKKFLGTPISTFEFFKRRWL